MATPIQENVKVKVVDISELKGRGLVAAHGFKKGDVLFEEKPLVSAQFSWNELYKYLACEFCLRSLESAEEMVRRLANNQGLSLPHPECCEVDPSAFTQCPQCQVLYCSPACRDLAAEQYHHVLCKGSSRDDPEHPLNRLVNEWRSFHYPPETTSVMLIAKMIAMVKQAKDKDLIVSQFSTFVKNAVSEKEEIAHKLLGEKFEKCYIESVLLHGSDPQILNKEIRKSFEAAGGDSEVKVVNPLAASVTNDDRLRELMKIQREVLRKLVSDALFEESVQEWFTPEGFSLLFALVGTNGQGIGSSSFSRWVKNTDNLHLNDAEKKELDDLIEKIYNEIDEVSGEFLDCEGSGLYQLQSACNHSCAPSAEIVFPHGDNTLAMVALKDIAPEEEISISYLDCCDLERSRHSRQKILRENYLFQCSCEKCLSQADNESVTSEESEDDEEMDDLN